LGEGGIDNAVEVFRLGVEAWAGIFFVEPALAICRTPSTSLRYAQGERDWGWE
jgi:hypothetical protein